MEAFSAVSSVRPSFFNNVMFDASEDRNSGSNGMLNYVYSRPHKIYNLVLAGSSGAGANCLSCCRRLKFMAYNFQTVPFRHSQSCCKVKRDKSGGNCSSESILLDEQTLKRELLIAIQEENYDRAAKIRDTLRILQEDSKASVLGANTRFYNSFRNGDLVAMQALWSKGEHVCVVHPGVSGISGHDLVMGSWEFVWADYDFPLGIEIKDVQVRVRGDMGYVTCIEMVKKNENVWGRHFATNVFERIDGQWFMCIHHASYVDL